MSSNFIYKFVFNKKGGEQIRQGMPQGDDKQWPITNLKNFTTMNEWSYSRVAPDIPSESSSYITNTCCQMYCLCFHSTLMSSLHMKLILQNFHQSWASFSPHAMEHSQATILWGSPSTCWDCDPTWVCQNSREEGSWICVGLLWICWSLVVLLEYAGCSGSLPVVIMGVPVASMG